MGEQNEDKKEVFKRAVHGEVEEEVWSECSASWWDRSLVPGDVNPHSSGLVAREANG